MGPFNSKLQRNYEKYYLLRRTSWIPELFSHQKLFYLAARLRLGDDFAFLASTVENYRAHCESYFEGKCASRDELRNFISFSKLNLSEKYFPESEISNCRTHLFVSYSKATGKMEESSNLRKLAFMVEP